jgi:hypothetical protein
MVLPQRLRDQHKMIFLTKLHPNLQPLLSEDNRHKSDKWTEEDEKNGKR